MHNVENYFASADGTAHSILKEDLGMRRICACWVPRLLDEVNSTEIDMAL